MAYAHNKIWRIRHPEKWLAEKRRNYARGRRKNSMSKTRWQKWELDLINNEADGFSDRDLAEKLGRSVQAIQIKRCRSKTAKRY